MSKKILFVVTSHDQLGNTGKQTGWYLPEVAHPYHVLSKKYHIDFVSPKGGVSPLDEGSKAAFSGDEVCKEFLADSHAQQLVNNTKRIDEVDVDSYAAILFPGGHGPMFDLAENESIGKATARVYEKGGVVAAVCHGPVALVNVKLSDGSYLVNGKNVTSFTNAEEDAVQLSNAMPFPLESKLKERGAVFSNADNWQKHVVVDGRLVTGQNPASSTALGEEVAKLLG